MTNRKIPTEIYSRVVGYYRPTCQWNPGKKAEFADRKQYNVKNLSKAIGENGNSN